MNDAPDELGLAFVYLTAPGRAGGDPRRCGPPGGARSPACTPARSRAARPRSPRSASRAARPPTCSSPMPYAAFQSALDDPPGYRNWWTAEHLDDLPRRRDRGDRTRSRGDARRPVAAVHRPPGAAPVARVRRRDAARWVRERALRRAPVRALGGRRPTTSARSPGRRGAGRSAPVARPAAVPQLRRRRGRRGACARASAQNYERLARGEGAGGTRTNVFRGNQNVPPAGGGLVTVKRTRATPGRPPGRAGCRRRPRATADERLDRRR